MGPKRNNILYIKPEEPAFLRRLKQQAGFKEGPTVDTKREAYRDDDDGDSDEFLEEKEDEKPIVVVLKTGDLTAEEAKNQETLLKEQEDKDLIEKGKIVFKSKKRLTQAEDTEVSTRKKTKKPDSSTKPEISQNHQKKSSLLSFADEHE